MYKRQIQGMTEKRNVSSDTGPVIPGLLLFQMLIDNDLPATGQKEIILSQHMVGPVTLSNRKTEINNIVGIIFDMGPGSRCV